MCIYVGLSLNMHLCVYTNTYARVLIYIYIYNIYVCIVLTMSLVIFINECLTSLIERIYVTYDSTAVGTKVCDIIIYILYIYILF